MVHLSNCTTTERLPSTPITGAAHHHVKPQPGGDARDRGRLQQGLGKLPNSKRIHPKIAIWRGPNDLEGDFLAPHEQPIAGAFTSQCLSYMVNYEEAIQNLITRAQQQSTGKTAVSPPKSPINLDAFNEVFAVGQVFERGMKLPIYKELLDDLNLKPVSIVECQNAKNVNDGFFISRYDDYSANVRAIAQQRDAGLDALPKQHMYAQHTFAYSAEVKLEVITKESCAEGTRKLREAVPNDPGAEIQFIDCGPKKPARARLLVTRLGAFYDASQGNVVWEADGKTVVLFAPPARNGPVMRDSDELMLVDGLNEPRRSYEDAVTKLGIKIEDDTVEITRQGSVIFRLKNPAVALRVAMDGIPISGGRIVWPNLRFFLNSIAMQKSMRDKAPVSAFDTLIAANPQISAALRKITSAGSRKALTFGAGPSP